MRGSQGHNSSAESDLYTCSEFQSLNYRRTNAEEILRARKACEENRKLKRSVGCKCGIYSKGLDTSFVVSRPMKVLLQFILCSQTWIY